MTRILLRLSSARGASLVELALVVPLLVVIVIGAVDFARVYYMAMELQSAARAGAQYGAQNSSMSTAQTVTQAAAVNINSVSAFAERWYTCGTDTNPGPTKFSSPPTCTSGQHVVTSVTVTAASTFSLISLYPMPGIPRSFSIFRSATMRVVE